MSDCPLCGLALIFIHEEVGYLHLDWEAEQTCGVVQ